MSIPPVLLMKHAKNNVRSRFLHIHYTENRIFPQRRFFTKFGVPLFVENRYRHVVLFVQNGKRTHNVRPYGKKDSLPFPSFGAVSDFRQTKK